MSDPYVGEVRLVGFTYAPIDWALCQGQSIPISSYEALYALIGTTYGGDGQSTFNLPDLQGRIPIHQGSNGASRYTLGQTAGTENVTLQATHFPAHTHNLMASTNPANSSSPQGQTLGSEVEIYANKAPSKAMNGAMVSVDVESNLPHNNMQPYLVLNWIIALNGIYPNLS